MKNPDSYFERRDNENIERLRNIIPMMPDYVEDYFLSIQTKTTPLTRLNYACDLRIFFDFLSARKYKKPAKEISIEDLDFLTSKDVERFLDYLSYYERDGKIYKCKENAKERKLCAVRAFLKYMFKSDLISSNIAEKVDSVKLHEKPILFLENHEVNDLLDTTSSGDGLSSRQKSWHNITKTRDTAIISVFLGTGIRISELVGINLEDVDYEKNAIRITRKGGNQQIVYFPQEVKDALNDYLDWLDLYKVEHGDFEAKITDPSALFLSMQGTRITARAVENLVKKYAKLVSPLKKITPHKLRSTFGTGLYRDTHDIYIVADVLGHKDINTTKKHYAAISEEMRKDVAKTVKLKKD